MISESRIFFIKKFLLGKSTRFRYILIVCREKQFYEKNRLGVWWKVNRGLGLASNPYKVEKYFMFGINLFHINTWVDIKWIGNTRTRGGLLTKET